MGLCFNDVGQALQPPLCQRMDRLQPKKNGWLRLKCPEKRGCDTKMSCKLQQTGHWKKAPSLGSLLRIFQLLIVLQQLQKHPDVTIHVLIVVIGNDKRLLTRLQQLETIQIIQEWQLHPECVWMSGCILLTVNVNLCSTFQRGSQNNKADSCKTNVPLRWVDPDASLCSKCPRTNLLSWSHKKIKKNPDMLQIAARKWHPGLFSEFFFECCCLVRSATKKGLQTASSSQQLVKPWRRVPGLPAPSRLWKKIKLQWDIVSSKNTVA
jgi:hypothetical protein